MADAPCSAAFRGKYATFSGTDYYDVAGFGFDESVEEVGAKGGTRIAEAWALDGYTLRAYLEFDVLKSPPAKGSTGATLTVYFLEIGATTGSISCTGMRLTHVTIDAPNGRPATQRFNFRFDPANTENTNPLSVTV